MEQISKTKSTLTNIVLAFALGLGIYSSVRVSQSYSLARNLAEYNTLQVQLEKEKKDLKHETNDLDKMREIYLELREKNFDPSEIVITPTEYPYHPESALLPIHIFKTKDGIYVGGQQGPIPFDSYAKYFADQLGDRHWRITEMENRVEELETKFKHEGRNKTD